MQILSKVLVFDTDIRTQAARVRAEVWTKWERAVEMKAEEMKTAFIEIQKLANMLPSPEFLIKELEENSNGSKRRLFHKRRFIQRKKISS